MQRARIFSIMYICTIVVYVIVLMLVPNLDAQAIAIIGTGMVVSIVVPTAFIHLTLTRLSVQDEENEAVNKTLRDELNVLKGKFAKVTTVDELTGCTNRRHFVELLGNHRAMSARGNYQFTVAVTQIDQFAAINEQHGSGRGAEALQLYSRIIKSALREVDVVAQQ